MSRTAVVALALASLVMACTKNNAEAISDTPPSTGAPGGVPMIKGAGHPGAVEGMADRGTGADTSFSVAVNAPAGATAGAEAIAKVKVTPGAGWKMNLEYPTRLKLTAPDGVAVQKTVLEIADVARLDEAELAFDVKLVAAKAGTYKVDGELKFAVCTPETCDPKKQTIAIELVAR